MNDHRLEVSIERLQVSIFYSDTQLKDKLIKSVVMQVAAEHSLLHVTTS